MTGPAEKSTASPLPGVIETPVKTISGSRFVISVLYGTIIFIVSLFITPVALTEGSLKEDIDFSSL